MGNARIGNGDVQAAKFLDAGFHHTFNKGNLAGIPSTSQTIAPFPTDFFGGTFGQFRVLIIEQNGSSPQRQLSADFVADALPGTGNQSNFSCEWHG